MSELGCEFGSLCSECSSRAGGSSVGLVRLGGGSLQQGGMGSDVSSPSAPAALQL